MNGRPWVYRCRRLTVACCLVVGGCLAACRGHERPPFDFMPNMRDSVAYDSFASNPLLANHQTLRPPAPGTIARGFLPLRFGPDLDEAERAGRELTNPIAPTPEALVRGQELYTTYCQVCHGPRGAGDGPLVPRIAAPPAYSSPQLRAYPPGRLFHVITFGRGRMPSYSGQIRTEDRWRLVHHLRTLQDPNGLGEPAS